MSTPSKELTRSWIPYPMNKSPSFLTEEDIQTVEKDRLLQFYTGLRLTFMIRASDIPLSLRETNAECFFAVLYEEINSGEYMDVGWVDEYVQAAHEISYRMQGYPKELRKQISELKKATQLPSGHRRMKIDSKTDDHKEYSFLYLDQKIRTRIYRHLLLAESIVIADWCLGSLERLKSIQRRTEYDVYDIKSRQLRRTTYTVRINGRTPFFAIGIMGTCRKVYEETSRVFYEENKFQFLGTGESILAYIHDRARRLDLMKKVELRFSTNFNAKFKGCYNMTCPIPAAPLTWIHCWRRIINSLVHSSMGLEDFRLLIDNSFWEHATWEDGNTAEAAIRVFTTEHLCERQPFKVGLSGNRDHPQNFLQHVARLGAVNIYLQIQGEETSPLKRSFSRELFSVIEANKQTRPYLADDSIPRCNCNRKYLRESCVWDREGRLSRGPRYQGSYIIGA